MSEFASRELNDAQEVNSSFTYVKPPEIPNNDLKVKLRLFYAQKPIAELTAFETGNLCGGAILSSALYQSLRIILDNKLKDLTSRLPDDKVLSLIQENHSEYLNQIQTVFKKLELYGVSEELLLAAIIGACTRKL